MHMLDRDAPARRDGGRHEHVVELLRVLVEKIGVALDVRDVRGHVDLSEQPIERGEDRARLRVLVAVTRNDDVRVRVQLQETLHECLEWTCKGEVISTMHNHPCGVINYLRRGVYAICL